MKRMQVIWSPLAEETYLKTLEFIIYSWSVKEAIAFELKVNSLLEKLKAHNALCPPSMKRRGLRRCVITPQTSLVYQISCKAIEIVAFFDNRSIVSY